MKETATLRAAGAIPLGQTRTRSSSAPDTGRMSQQPSPPSAGPVGTLWRLTSAPGEYRVLPDGVVDLMYFDGRLFVAGPDTAGYTGTSPASDAYGLRLNPGVAAEVLGLPMNELAGTTLDLADVVHLPSALTDAAHRDPAAALAAIARRLWTQADVDRRSLALAASLDKAARGGQDVRTIAGRHHLSERTLRRIAHRTFGYGMKTLTSIHRFQQALALAREGEALAQVAAAAGYADQAHLARETRRFAGVTMTELLA